MSFQNDENELWKKDLISLFVDSLCNNSSSKESVAKVGYYYSCCAPAYIYKYYSVDPLNLDAIKNNKMWYSAPVRFNDVFDCDLLIDKDAIEDSFIKQYPGIRKIRPGSPAWLKFQDVFDKSLIDLKSKVEAIREELGITCLSESYDSLLMWAHYASNHSGMCIEYDLIKIFKELSFTPVPVIYSEKKASLNTISLNGDQRETMKAFLECLTSKSPEWKYEKEWRIIRDNKACGDCWSNEKRGALLNMIEPHSIILGCMVRNDLENKVKAYCEEKRINLYKMEKDEKLSKLNKKQVLVFDDEI